jgi:Holliday junction resolvase RusA-like endonuclease
MSAQQLAIDGRDVPHEQLVAGDARPLVLELQVLGRPQPAGSKKGFYNRHTGRVIITDDAKKSKPWKQEVAGAALAQLGDAHELSRGPLALELIFYLARPKGHYGTGRNAGKVKASAPLFPAVKPDTTKLVRAVEDALTGIAWKDDAQVVDQAAKKRYGVPERVEILVYELPAV